MHLTQGRLLLVPCVLCIALAFPTSPVVPRETSTPTMRSFEISSKIFEDKTRQAGNVFFDCLFTRFTISNVVEASISQFKFVELLDTEDHFLPQSSFEQLCAAICVQRHVFCIGQLYTAIGV